MELVKDRAYGLAGEAQAASARGALNITLETLLKLFAPFLPFVTEEVWSWWKDGTVHTSTWPTAQTLHDYQGAPELTAIAAEALSQLRKAKSEAKVSMRADISSVTVTASAQTNTALASAASDLRAAGRMLSDFEYVESGETTGASMTLEVTLAPVEEK